MAKRLGMSPDARELLLAERYLVREGYIAPANPGRPDGPYNITQTGWMDPGYRPTAEGSLRRRPWWKRLLGV